MALLIECPDCKYRSAETTLVCRCGCRLKKHSGRVFWIEYYADGRRRRERVGTNRALAKTRLEKVLVARAEDRLLDKNKNVKHTLGELCSWYLQLPEVKAKSSWSRDKGATVHIRRILGESTRVSDLGLGQVSRYQERRLSELSPRRREKRVAPATVNRELACLKTLLNKAVRHGRIDSNPARDAPLLPENNVRERVLSQAEFEGLLSQCPSHIAPLVLTAYYLPMRKAEILKLTWAEVDLESRFIRLPGRMTKTRKPRLIPVHPRVLEVLKGLPRGLHTKRVFLKDGEPFEEFRHSFRTACQEAGIADFTFHDLRHCAINNLRLAGNDYFKIMAISGHRTTSVFKRYNLVTEEELSHVQWHDQARNRGWMDTYMDTRQIERGHGDPVTP